MTVNIRRQRHSFDSPEVYILISSWCYVVTCRDSRRPCIYFLPRIYISMTDLCWTSTVFTYSVTSAHLLFFFALVIKLFCFALRTSSFFPQTLLINGYFGQRPVATLSLLTVAVHLITIGTRAEMLTRVINKKSIKSELTKSNSLLIYFRATKM